MESRESSWQLKKDRKFCVGTFNIRGLVDDTKKEQLVRDVNKYGVDICALQETKIKDAGEYCINGSTLITFESKSKHYGNGFVVSPKLKDKIHKFWRESDRICVLQLAETNYKCEIKDDLKVKIVKQGTKPRNTINIINVYAPTSDRGKKFPAEVEKFYKQLEKVSREL
jgi:exonuclease III